MYQLTSKKFQWSIILGSFMFLLGTTQLDEGFTFDHAVEATVIIESIKTAENFSIQRKGAGAFLSSTGLLITSYHILEEAQTIEVTLKDGRCFLAERLLDDPVHDLALLKIDIDNVVFFLLGNDDELRLGNKVFAIGNPGELNFSLTSGVVSAFNRKINTINHPQREENFIQTDVPTNPGSSGGPLINQKGQLVGINTAIDSKNGRFEGYSFAVPTGMVRGLLNKFDN